MDESKGYVFLLLLKALEMVVEQVLSILAP